MTIFHIAHASDWDAALAEGEYLTSTRGLGLHEVGFIHAASAGQLAGVALRFYLDDLEDLVVLEIDDNGLDVRWEDGGEGELFPHIYEPIRPASVTAALPASFDRDHHFHWDN